MIEAKILEDFVQVKIISPVTGSFKKDVDCIKALPGRSYRDGYWYIPTEQKYNLIDIFGDEIFWYNEQPADHDKPVFAYLDDTIANMDTSHFKLPPFPYQVVGASFLVANQVGILADQPGIGKTLQAIMAADYMFRTGNFKRVLVVAPSAVKYQWAGEIEKFTDYTYSVIDGVPKKRQQQMAAPAHFYLTNYELVRQPMDLKMLTSMGFDAIILDEAHRIKDYTNQTNHTIRQLEAKYKWLLTGTPMQNKPDELYGLFIFMDENILGKPTAFRNKFLIIGRKYGRYGVTVGYKNMGLFRQIIAPYMMRRTVEEVLPQMPSVIITNFMVEMTKEQTKVHDKIADDMIKHLDSLKQIKDEDQQKIAEDQVLGYKILMQEVCDSLTLLAMSDSKMAARYALPTNRKSPKLIELYDILEERLSNNPTQKIVVFTQFERMQRLIGDHVSKLGEASFISGKMKAFQKQAARDKFKYDANIRFLICTDAAKEGLNLPEASLLINFDIPWNPAVLTQRIGRIRRADSKHDHLEVINMIAVGGIDERILEAVYDKQHMADFFVEKDITDRKALANLTNKVISKIKKERNGKK